MKRWITFLLLAALLFLTGCSSVPQKHQIPYPEGLETLSDADGADAYNGSLDKTGKDKYFTANDYYNMKSSGTLHILSHFETYQQTTEYTCACAAACMVLHYYGIDSYTEMDVASLAGTVEYIGTSPEGLAQFFDMTGLTYDSNLSKEKRFQTGNEAEAYIVERIDAGEPILVNWEDYGGHWQVIIGIDTCKAGDCEDDVLILADPYDISDHYQDGYYIYSLGRFFEMWREGACANAEIPDEQPFISPDKP